MVFRHSLDRRECPEHGDTFVWTGGDCCSRCGRQAPRRTYVAVDALLTDKAAEAARRRLTAPGAVSMHEVLRAAIEEATRVPS